MSGRREEGEGGEEVILESVIRKLASFDLRVLVTPNIRQRKILVQKEARRKEKKTTCLSCHVCQMYYLRLLFIIRFVSDKKKKTKKRMRM